MKFDFIEYARQIAASSGREAMVPVIEKELLHYEILTFLDQQGLLGRLSFQGGTCLRLCYGSLRYSEDLDFAAGDRFSSIDLDSMTHDLSEHLEHAFGVSARSRTSANTPSVGHVGVQRWWVIVDTMPERPDLPSQRIKVEIASVPSHTRDMRRLQLHYSQLPVSYELVLAVCESLPEILADKLISFAESKYVRYRDAWDIPWIMRQPNIDLSSLGELVQLKHADYYCEKPLAVMMCEGKDRSVDAMGSKAFLDEMRRFIPQGQFIQTLGRDEFREVMARDIKVAYNIVLES